jgi:ParB family chromosome partitioning protein
VQRGAIPLTTALEIARAKDDDESLGEMLQEAYENGQLNRRQIIETKRLVEKRQAYGPGSPDPAQIKPPTSSYSLVRTYQREVERQCKMVLKAEHAHQRRTAIKALFAGKAKWDASWSEGKWHKTVVSVLKV